MKPNEPFTYMAVYTFMEVTSTNLGLRSPEVTLMVKEEPAEH